MSVSTNLTTPAVAVGSILFGVGIAYLLIGCASGLQHGAEATYLAEQLACVDKAKTLTESQECRAKVQAEWAKDGGVE